MTFPWSESLIAAPPAAQVLFKMTLWLAVAWAAYFAVRGRNPRWRQLILRGAMAGLLLIPVLALALPAWRIAIAPPPVGQSPPATTLGEPIFESSLDTWLYNGNRAAAGDAFIPFAAETELYLEEAPQPLAAAALLTLAQPAPPAWRDRLAATSGWLRLHWPAALIGLWATVAAALALRLALALLAVWAQVRRSLPATADARLALDRAARAMGYAGPIGLRCSAELTSPFLTGILRPVIVLPVRMTREDYAPELPAIFAHELSHLMSSDLLWMTLAQSLGAALWFHPLAWKIHASHSAACEEISDREAAQAVGDARAYSSSLARVALELMAAPPITGGIPMARFSEIRGRLEALKRRIDIPMLDRRGLAATLVGGGLLLAALGSARLVHAEQAAAPRPARDAKELLPVAAPRADQSSAERVLMDRERLQQEAQRLRTLAEGQFRTDRRVVEEQAQELERVLERLTTGGQIDEQTRERLEERIIEARERVRDARVEVRERMENAREEMAGRQEEAQERFEEAEAQIRAEYADDPEAMRENLAELDQAREMVATMFQPGGELERMMSQMGDQLAEQFGQMEMQFLGAGNMMVRQREMRMNMAQVADQARRTGMQAAAQGIRSALEGIRAQYGATVREHGEDSDEARALQQAIEGLEQALASMAAQAEAAPPRAPRAPRPPRAPRALRPPFPSPTPRPTPSPTPFFRAGNRGLQRAREQAVREEAAAELRRAAQQDFAEFRRAAQQAVREEAAADLRRAEAQRVRLRALAEDELRRIMEEQAAAEAVQRANQADLRRRNRDVADRAQAVDTARRRDARSDDLLREEISVLRERLDRMEAERAEMMQLLRDMRAEMSRGRGGDPPPATGRGRRIPPPGADVPPPGIPPVF